MLLRLWVDAMSTSRLFQKLPFFPGWLVVGAVALILSTANASRYAFGVFLKPMVNEYHWSRSQLSLAASIGMVLGGALQPVVGLMADRFGTKKVILLGVTLTGIVMELLSYATQLWQIYLLYGFILSFAVASTSQVAASKLVSSWFVRRRGISMAAAMSGTAIGQLIIVPIATWMMVLTSDANGNGGWRTSYRVMSTFIFLVIIPIGLYVIRNTPQEVGLEPDARVAPGEARPSPARPLGQDRATRLPEAIRTFTFYQIIFGFVVCGFTMSFVSTHFVPFATDMGMNPIDSSKGLSIAGGISIVGALLTGWVSDRWGRRGPLAFTYFLRGLGFFILLWAGNLWVLYLSAAVIGLSWTSTTPLGSAISADTYGRKNLGFIFGLMQGTMSMGSAIGAYCDAQVYDITGSYHYALLLNGFLGLAAALVTLTIREREPVPVLPRRGAPALSGATGGD